LLVDDPDAYLPDLLAEMDVIPSWGRRTFAFRSPHPRERQLRDALGHRGWHDAPSGPAAMTISFSSLRKPTPASFTLIRDGRIRDLRRHHLFDLWLEMGRTRRPSACVTTIAFQNGYPAAAPGEWAVLYRDGRLVDRMPLHLSGLRILDSRRGRIVVRIEGGRAGVEESSCRRQICRATPPVSMAGERIVCAPQHFFLEIKGESGLDTVIG
jgi:hypothetical protein